MLYDRGFRSCLSHSVVLGRDREIDSLHQGAQTRMARLKTNPLMGGLSLEMFKLFYQLSESNNFEALIVLLEGEAVSLRL